MKYEVTSPEGITFEVEAPKGASQEDLFEFAQSQPAYQEALENKRITGLGPVDATVEAVKNIPSSAAGVGSDIWSMLSNPVETAKSVGGLATDVLRKYGPFGGRSAEEVPSVSALGEFASERYGSPEALKRTLVKDPVGAAMDVAGVAGLGGTVIPKLGKVASAIDPISNVARLAKAPIKATGKLAEALATQGVGRPSALKKIASEARRTPIIGDLPPGAAAMRGQDSLTRIMEDSMQVVRDMHRRKVADYKAGIKGVKADKTKLNFSDVDDALNQFRSETTLKGVSKLDDVDQRHLANMQKTVDDWKKNPELHDAEGFDFLKQRIDAMNISPTEHPQAFRLKTRLRNEVKDTIVKQVPDYKDVMKAYEDASKQIGALEKELSLGNRANVGTRLNKLQSIMKDSATDYRIDLARSLDNQGMNITDRIAGQSLKDIVPPGVVSKLNPFAGVGGGYVLGGPAGAAAGAVLTSPRLMGEGARASGILARLGDKAASAMGLQTRMPNIVSHGAFQSGRLNEEIKKRKRK